MATLKGVWQVLPRVPRWVTETNSLYRAVVLAKRRHHNARMLLKGLVGWATELVLVAVAGDEKKLRRVRNSFAVWREAIGSAEWVETFDPELVGLAGPPERVPANQWLKEQRRIVNTVTMPEEKKQREWVHYMGKRFVRRFGEETVSIALERFDPKQHAMSQDCWGLLMETLREALALSLIQLVRPGLEKQMLDEERRTARIQCMWLALKSLSPADRQLAFQVAGKESYRTIAADLKSDGEKVTAGALRVRVSRIKARLGKKLEDIYGEAYGGDK